MSGRCALRAAIALLLGILVLPAQPARAEPPAQVEAGATLAVLAGDVQVSFGGGPFHPAEDGTTLAVGDRVRTGPASHALLTYFDGSTTQLEPETEIAIRRVEADAGQQTFFVSLGLSAGTLWNRVSQLLGFGAQFEVGGQTA
ncbi:MAG: hypothetical protein HY691_06255, partial [Chloroflexi bacterium]|nr:hypothetical protein [Chloroflexota bacterium]